MEPLLRLFERQAARDRLAEKLKIFFLPDRGEPL
jgi:hypothetical protein